MAVQFAPAISRRLVLVSAIIALAGCATMATTPEQAVSQRAAENWKARQAADFATAYTFMPPSYRAVTPLAAYKRSFGVATQLTDVKVEKVVCESADKCVATLRLEAKVLALRGKAPPVVTYYDEVWVRENAQWWVFPTQ
jgi:hypothetical protein